MPSLPQPLQHPRWQRLLLPAMSLLPSSRPGLRSHCYFRCRCRDDSDCCAPHHFRCRRRCPTLPAAAPGVAFVVTTTTKTTATTAPVAIVVVVVSAAVIPLCPLPPLFPLSSPRPLRRQWLILLPLFSCPSLFPYRHSCCCCRYGNRLLPFVIVAFTIVPLCLPQSPSLTSSLPRPLRRPRQ